MTEVHALLLKCCKNGYMPFQNVHTYAHFHIFNELVIFQCNVNYTDSHVILFYIQLRIECNLL